MSTVDLAAQFVKYHADPGFQRLVIPTSKGNQSPESLLQAILAHGATMRLQIATWSPWVPCGRYKYKLYWPAIGMDVATLVPDAVILPHHDCMLPLNLLTMGHFVPTGDKYMHANRKLYTMTRVEYPAISRFDIVYTEVDNVNVTYSYQFTIMHGVAQLTGTRATRHSEDTERFIDGYIISSTCDKTVSYYSAGVLVAQFIDGTLARCRINNVMHFTCNFRSGVSCITIGQCKYRFDFVSREWICIKITQDE